MDSDLDHYARGEPIQGGCGEPGCMEGCAVCTEPDHEEQRMYPHADPFEGMTPAELLDLMTDHEKELIAEAILGSSLLTPTELRDQIVERIEKEAEEYEP